MDPTEKFYFNDNRNETITKYGIIGKSMNGKGNTYISHQPAHSIKKCIDNYIFDSYFKFCIVRNPHDLMVSSYFWRKSKNLINDNITFENWIKTYSFNKKLNNYHIYSIDNKPVCDYYIRYENLVDDINNVLNILGIKKIINKCDLPNHKRNIRPKIHYKKFYKSQETIDIVSKHFEKEIKLFNYKF